jgi:hypothetical protein
MEIAVLDPSGCVHRVQVTCMIPTGDGGSEEVVYTLEDSVPLAT